MSLCDVWACSCFVQMCWIPKTEKKKTSSSIVSLSVCLSAMFCVCVCVSVQLFKLQKPDGLGLTDRSFCQSDLGRHHLGSFCFLCLSSKVMCSELFNSASEEVNTVTALTTFSMEAYTAVGNCCDNVFWFANRSIAWLCINGWVYGHLLVGRNAMVRKFSHWLIKLWQKSYRLYRTFCKKRYSSMTLSVCRVLLFFSGRAFSAGPLWQPLSLVVCLKVCVEIRGAAFRCCHLHQTKLRY